LVSDATKQVTHDGLVWHANMCLSVEMSTLGLCPLVDISTSGHIY